MSRRSLWFRAAARRPWIIYAVCLFVALLVVPYWVAYARQGHVPEGVTVQTVEVTGIDEPDERPTEFRFRIEGRERNATIDADLSVGDEVDVWTEDGATYRTGQEQSLGLGLILTAVIWGAAGFAAWGTRRRSKGTLRQNGATLGALAAALALWVFFGAIPIWQFVAGEGSAGSLVWAVLVTGFLGLGLAGWMRQRAKDRTSTRRGERSGPISS